MTLPDGPTLLGIAAIITSITGLVTALRISANRQTLDQPEARLGTLRQHTQRERGMVDNGGQGG